MSKKKPGSIDGISDAFGLGELEKFGLYAIIFGIILLFERSQLGFLVLIGSAVFFGIAGVAALFSDGENENVKRYPQSRESNRIMPTTSAPMTDESTIADKIKAIHIANDFKCPSCGATVNPTDTKCKSCGSFLVASANLPKPKVWGDVEIGQPIHVAHPKNGELALSVRNRTYYGELWQAKMKSNVPWTLTGNYFVGLGLENGLFLLNWQSRFYLLELDSSLTDKDINQNFAQPAREFAASNQSKYVSFVYNKKTWEIEDIGRFRIEFTEGDGTKANAGAVGRFIHATQGSQILVIEDYQSGASGTDNLRMGYKIAEKDIKI